MLDGKQLERFARNIRLDGVGESGQEKLLKSAVLVMGAGGLGSAAILYLAAAGIGTLAIVDSDRVELSNLQRQVVHFTEDIGREKAVSAAEKAVKINPAVKIIPIVERVTSENIVKVITGYDFVIDAVDNFSTKYLINEHCVKMKIPFSHTGVQGFTGQLLTVVPGSACVACVFGSEPEKGEYTEPAVEGVLGAVAGFAGTMQAAEAVKSITGAGELLTGKIFSFDLRTNRFKIIKTDRHVKCRICGEIK